MIHPKAVLIELNNTCNARCVYCATLWDLGKPQHMDFALYQSILAALPQTRQVDLNQYGEPLLYPRFLDALRHAKSEGLYVWITTNAGRLDEETSRAMLEAGIDRVDFSVDGSDAETFERLRPGLKWETVLRNIETFKRLRDEGGHRTVMRARVTVTKENAARKTEIRRFWRTRADTVSMVPELDVSPRRGGVVSGAPVLCIRPFQHLTIRVDGSVVMCCRDSHRSYVMGNVRQTSPLEVFNCAKFRGIRKAMRSGIGYPAMCRGCLAGDPDVRPPKRYAQ